MTSVSTSVCFAQFYPWCPSTAWCPGSSVSLTQLTIMGLSLMRKMVRCQRCPKREQMVQESPRAVPSPQRALIEVYQAAQRHWHADLAVLLLLRALCRAKIYPVLPTGLSYSNDFSSLEGWVQTVWSSKYLVCSEEIFNLYILFLNEKSGEGKILFLITFCQT